MNHLPPTLDEYTRPYPLANVLHEGPSASIRTVLWYDRWWAIVLQLLVIAAAILCCMYEAGCFGK